MGMADELAWMPVGEIARKIRGRQLSPVEVVDAVLARIEARNPSLTALVEVRAEEARAKAKEAEAALTQGGELGPLHGVPTAFKDLYGFKPGWRATFGGIRALKDFTARHWSYFPERVEKAGAILVGSTNSPTMGFRGCTDNYLFGPTRNPFDASRNAGGSSGGGAAAVADGLLPFAEGTDGGGSIRIPASWCGIVGFKASAGRIPYVARPNAFGGTSPFLHTGPLTRTVEDAALVASVLAGHDPRDPFSVDQPVDLLAATRRSVRGWRIGFSPNFGVFPVEGEVRALVAEAARAFAEAGAVVEEVKLGIERPQGELSDLWCRLIMPTNLRALAALKRAGYDILSKHADDLPPDYRRWVEVGQRQRAEEHQADQEIRSEVFDAVQAVFARYDLLVGPTLCCAAVPNQDDGDTKGPSAIEGEAVDPLIGWCPTYLFNFTGHPAISVPCGLAQGGLPVGLQIVGRRWADADVLAAAATFERLRPWADSYRIPAGRPLPG